VRVPLDYVTSFSTRTVDARYYTLVRVVGDDGVAGIGFCYAGSQLGELSTVAVQKLLSDRVRGQDAHRVEGLWQDMYQESLLQGRAGAVHRGLSALDIALWDRNARAADLPLHRYLGAVELDSVGAYASGGYYREGKSPGDLAEEMASYAASGFTAFKVKVGMVSPREDAERIAAVRAAVGPDGLMMLDANNAWQDVPTAVRALRMWEEFDPYWIEEPFSPDDIESHAKLAQLSPVPVATGEIEAGRWRHQELLEKGAAQILQTDAAVCGGISEFRRIAAAADSRGVTMSPHWFHDLHAPLVASTPNARFVEYFADDQVLNFRRLLDRQMTVRDGRLLLHQMPGLGFDFDEAAVDEYGCGEWA